MDNFAHILDLRPLLFADSPPLFPGLEMQPTSFDTSVYHLLSAPPVLNMETKVPADDTSQRRINEYSIKPVTPYDDVYSVAEDHGSHPELSSFEPPKSSPPESELSKAPPTNSEHMQAEEMGADIDRLTPLEQAEKRVDFALKREASRKTIRRTKVTVKYHKVRAKKKALLEKLEANLSPKQIAAIRTESEKCTSGQEDKSKVIMQHLEKHRNDPLPKKYGLEFLCNALVNDQKAIFDRKERKLFCAYKRSITSSFCTFRSRKIHKEYIRLLTIANEIAKH